MSSLSFIVHCSALLLEIVRVNTASIVNILISVSVVSRLASSLTVHFVSVLQGARHGPQIILYRLGPTLHVSDLLQTFVETLDQSQPGSRLLGEVTRVQVQLFSLRVQSFLVEIGLKCDQF